MSDEKRFFLLKTVLMCGFLITLSPTHAQTRHQSEIPATLLSVIDEDDRNCVLNEGGIRKHVRVAPIRLAPKGKQILIRGSDSCLCGAQNCPFWIYRKVTGQYELLLKGIGSTKVNAGRKLAFGYRDLITETHASANETLIRTYRFDGKHYQASRCVSRDYFDDNGRPVKVPVFRPCE